MTQQRNKRTCAHCGEPMTGCSCSWKKASDGKLVHKHCRKDYEAKLGNKAEVVCAYCGGAFDGKPYFKTMDGKYAHFSCVHKYDRELRTKNNK